VSKLYKDEIHKPNSDLHNKNQQLQNHSRSMHHNIEVNEKIMSLGICESPFFKTRKKHFI